MAEEKSDIIFLQQQDIDLLPILHKKCETQIGRLALLVSLIDMFDTMPLEQRKTFANDANDTHQCAVSLACSRLAFCTLNKSHIHKKELWEEARKIYDELCGEYVEYDKQQNPFLQNIY